MYAAPRWTRARGKVPLQTSGRLASSTDPGTWASFDEVQQGRGDGYGFMLGAGWGCYDLDHVTDDESRRFISTVPERILFCERSLSGEGVHVFVEAPEAPGWRRIVDGLQVERYTRERFIRMTGSKFDPHS
jgi:primase-polymerase (primpol)-like protein